MHQLGHATALRVLAESNLPPFSFPWAVGLWLLELPAVALNSSMDSEPAPARHASWPSSLWGWSALPLWLILIILPLDILCRDEWRNGCVCHQRCHGDSWHGHKLNMALPSPFPPFHFQGTAFPLLFWELFSKPLSGCTYNSYVGLTDGLTNNET